MKLLLLITLSMSLYAGVIGCKYQSDLKKVDTVSNKLKFMYDNHCANMYDPSDWKRIKKDKIYTLIQSPHKGEENFKYWVKTAELPKLIKKKAKPKTKKNDQKSSISYGDLIWQDSLINEDTEMSYNKAYNYCKKLDYIGIRNWRLPTLAELQQIRPAFSKDQPYKELKHFKLNGWVWTSDKTLQFTFASGASNFAGDYPARVRCVAPRR